VQRFLSEFGQIVFYAVYLSILLFVPVAVATIRRRHAPSVKAKFGTRLVGLWILSSIVIALWIGYSGIALLPDWAYFVGLSLSLLGFAIWLWGQHTLGRYFSSEVIIYEDHQLVERGPYKFVRHPMYTGGVLMSLGMGLAVQSWFATLITTVAFLLAILYRIGIEEKALITEFGEQYTSYSRRVKRLIPFIF
jgi:protein-S-isoprenylcysteine O-methyltransferase Ste14